MTERRKCATCPGWTTATYCKGCAPWHRKPKGQGKNAEVTLFSGTNEANGRRRAVLDAIDLVAIADSEGWVNYLTWADRNGYTVSTQAHPSERARGRHVTGPRDAGLRQWERIKQRLRAHGIEVAARDPEDIVGAAKIRHGSGDTEAFRFTALRFTVDGWDRLQALTKALDDWLCSGREETL